MPQLIPLVLLFLTFTISACSSLGGRNGGPGDPRGGQNQRGREDIEEARLGNSRTGAPSVIEQLQLQLRDTAEELKLTPRQVPLWDAYQEKISALMSDLLRIEPYHLPHQTAPQQIAQKVGTVRNRLTALEDIAEAAEKLYRSLDENQKKVADARLAQTLPTLYSGLGDGLPRNNAAPEGRGGERPSGGMGRPGGIGGGMGRFFRGDDSSK